MLNLGKLAIASLGFISKSFPSFLFCRQQLDRCSPKIMRLALRLPPNISGTTELIIILQGLRKGRMPILRDIQGSVGKHIHGSINIDGRD